MRSTPLVLSTAALFVLLGTLAGSGRAEDLPPGYGANAPSGSTFTSDIANPAGVVKNPTPESVDQDGYAFQGFQGMVLTATLKPGKGSGLVPNLDVVRPGGSLATDEDGLRIVRKGATLTATMSLDASGWWQLKVRGAELTRHIVTAEEALASPDPLDKEGDVLATFSSGAYTLLIKYTSPSIPALPLVSKGFTVSTDIDSKIDTDDYRFPGYDGQSLTATLKIGKGSHLLPAITLNRPDGTEVTDPGVIVTKGTTVTVKTTMDQAGTWKMRVRGLKPTPDPDPTGNSSTSGPYTLAVKLGKVASVPSLQPDGNNQYRFSIPAVGGATVAYTLTYSGAAPTFNSLKDPTGAIVPGSGGGTSVKALLIPAALPIGNYTLTFDAPATPPTKVAFSSKLTLKKGAKAVKRTLSGTEPVIFNNSVNPTAGGGGTPMTITVSDKTLDPNDPDPSNIKAYLGHTPLLNTSYNSGIIHGTVPVLPLGVYDVIVESSTGQVAAKVGAFTVVSSPTSTVIDPNVGTDAGGFPITITGTGYRPGRMGIQIDGRDVPVNITDATATSITFIAPPRSPTTVTFGVIDLETRLAGTLQQNSFEYVSTASISRVVPSLTTVLGGDTLYVKGANFAATDTVYIENNDHATYQAFTGTFLDASRHVLIAPPRNKGTYKVYVQNSFGQPSPPKTRNLTYFQFTRLANAIPNGSDGYDGVTNAMADYDKDGYDDIVVSRAGTTASSASLTRVLHNDGAIPPHFTDVTSVVMPAVTAREDWRAHRIWLSDVTQDGYPDLLLVTDDTSVLATSASHLRILVNEARGGGTNPNERVFRDQTTELLQEVRVSGPLYGGTASVVDNWRGLDMWVGDVDRGPPGPPEILITHKELKEELDVGCGAYCASPYASGYTYGFYWGGSRAFVWDKSAKGGEGMYRFERNFFPRKSGVRVQIFNPPAGVTIPICNSSYGHPCRGKFTPFIGKRITAGDLDADGKPDVAVLSDAIVQKDGATIASLQVGINKFNPSEGSLVTDVTSFFTLMGGDFKGDTVEIGQPGYPDGNAYGVIAMTKASGPPGGGVVMRIISYKKPALINQIADFEDVSSPVLPLAPLNDRWQASRIIFRDIDSDGDQDMIMVCDAPPGTTDAAFRVMRNEIVNQQVGVFRETLKGLISSQTSVSDHLEAEAMSIGDVNKDGTYDFVLSRAGTSATPPQTRVLIIDK